MPAVAQVNKSTAGGGLVLGPGAPTVMCEGFIVATVGDHIAPHGLPPHDNATIVQGSSTVTAEGKPVAYFGALCSCGHTLINCAATTDVGP